MRPRGAAAVPALLLALAPVTSACGAGEETLTVLAASSLTDVLPALAARFEDEHPTVRVRLALGSSTTLARQVAEGAPGDVLITADPASMAVAERAGAVTRPVTVTRNALTLVTPAGNPGGVASPADLGRVPYAVCVPTAPCGAAAADFLDEHAVAQGPVSTELDVRGVLARVRADEVDAGLVYGSDARAAGEDVEVVRVPDTPVVDYQAGMLVDGDLDLATAWMKLLLGPTGQAALADAGFLPARDE